MNDSFIQTMKQEYPETPFTRAVAAGYVDERAVRAGLAIRTGEKHGSLDMVKGHMLLACAIIEPPAAPKCTVDGEPVDELAVLVKPCAFFVTTQNGTHEVNRCYFHDGVFKYGVDISRIGGCATERVEYNTREGLRIHFDKGYEMFIPVSHCQGSWRRAV